MLTSKTTPDLVLRLGLASFALAGAASCAQGIEPPEPNAMVEIRTGLDFEFGPEGSCKGSDDVPCGATEGVPVQFPKVSVKLAPFAIDADEVTNFQYEYCVEKGVCTDPKAYNAISQSQIDYYRTERFRDYPVVSVSWQQANEYCKFVGKRLPTEVEWERVAKGAGTPRAYPVDFPMTVADDCNGKLNAVGCGGDQSYEETGASSSDFVTENGSKIFHLAANAAEWTDTWYQLDVTCQGDAPCKRTDQCGNDDACKTLAASCPACSSVPASEGECFFQCDGTSTKTVVCDAYSASGLDPSEFLPDSGSDKAIRGGSVSVTRTQRCLLHGWNRDQRNTVTFVSPSVGFRCAKSL